MKKLFVLLLATLIALPLFAQTKEEKEAQQKALYDNAKEAVENKDWVIIPTEVTNAEGRVSDNNDASIFIAYEKSGEMYLQGWSICGNSDTNVVEVKDYKIKYNKKGDITVMFSVLGRKVRGSYIIRINHEGNQADVTFTPGTQSVTVKRFSGPIVKCGQANYFKRSNAI